MCVDLNWTIGDGDKLLFNIPEDMQLFKQLTIGNTVIMGRKTYASIGKPLPHRLNIILSSHTYISNKENLIWINSLDDALLQSLSKKDIYIIGGASLFNEYRDKCDEIYVTHVISSKDYENPIRVNPLNDEWIRIYTSPHKAYVNNDSTIYYYFSKFIRKSENNKG